MRIVKDAEERKNEILDVAERLFCAKGFDKASTNDILEEIGIASETHIEKVIKNIFPAYRSMRNSRMKDIENVDIL